ncbi:MAG: DUF1833 family protein [Pseudomonadota bacterium]
MTYRDVPAAPLAALERQETPEALLAFLTITHENLPAPIRVVSDVMDYVIGGATWIGLPFDYQILTDDEGAPQSQIRMQNVDRRIGQALRSVNSRAQMSLTIRSSADFNLSVDPRTEAVANPPLYQFLQFDLVDVTVNAVEITGRVMLRDYAQEPWPGLRATQSRVPGLFR